MHIFYYAQFVLLIGNDATELFDYYNVDQMHGVNKADCITRINEGGTYIEGFCNYDPRDSTLSKDPLPFVFINKSSLKGDHRDITLINHEMSHLALLLNNWDVDNKEEEIVTFAEEQTNLIYVNHFSEEHKQMTNRRNVMIFIAGFLSALSLAIVLYQKFYE